MTLHDVRTCPMCGASNDAMARRCLECGEPQVVAVLKRRSWLRRKFLITLPEGTYTVEYSGWRLGYEQVSVDPGSVLRKTSFWWFVPRFDFDIGGHPAVVEVCVGPWFTIREFRLRIDGRIYYED